MKDKGLKKKNKAYMTLYIDIKRLWEHKIQKVCVYTNIYSSTVIRPRTAVKLFTKMNNII